MNKNKTLLSVTLGALIVIGVAVFLLWLKNSTTKDTEIIISDSGFEVKGMFGDTYDFNNVTSVELKDTMPTVTRKNNGSALGVTKKGDFSVDGLGECKLFILSDKGPFLYIKTTDLYIIINYKERDKTEKLYEELLSKMGR